LFRLRHGVTFHIHPKDGDRSRLRSFDSRVGPQAHIIQRQFFKIKRQTNVVQRLLERNDRQGADHS
jgi:hypothetical protein